jgi:Zn-dependent M28 family amino/carboxypeptidase
MSKKVISNLKLSIAIGLFMVTVFVSCIMTNPVLTRRDKKIQLSANIASMKKDLYFLAFMRPARNVDNLKALDSTATYIYDRLSKYSSYTKFQEYNHDKKKFRNVIATFNEGEKERIVIGAHYDVCGEQPGADDNASGVAGLLELARMIDSLKPKLNYRIDLVAYSTEEPPYFKTDLMGSAIHAKSLAKEKAKVKLMVSLEMIGYFCESDDCQTYPVNAMKLFYPSKGNYIMVVDRMTGFFPVRRFKKLMTRAADIDVRSLNAPKFMGIDLSDHRNYWSEGFPALMLTNTSFYRNKLYHERGDTYDRINFNRMAEVVKGVYWAVVNL